MPTEQDLTGLSGYPKYIYFNILGSFKYSRGRKLCLVNNINSIY